MVNGQVLPTAAVTTGLRQNHLQALVVRERPDVHRLLVQSSVETRPDHELRAPVLFCAIGDSRVRHREICVRPIQQLSDGRDIHARRLGAVRRNHLGKAAGGRPVARLCGADQRSRSGRGRSP